MRLDLKLLQNYKSSSRSQIQNLIRSGRVTVNETVVTKTGYVVDDHDRIQCTEFIVDNPDASHLSEFDFEIPTIYEDDSLIVINKPRGISMHPGAGDKHKTVANALVGRVQQKKFEGSVFHSRPGIVHRLDKDTTGIVVVAKNVKIHAALAKQFADRTTGRRYTALVLSTPRGKRMGSTDFGTINQALGRDPKNRKRMALVKEGEGRKAVTHWTVLERMSYATCIDVRLETGRTHQIRVHMASIDCPVIGDQVYGNFNVLPEALKRTAQQFGRQALHARWLSFIHPETNARMEFETCLPNDMQNLIQNFREYS